MTDRVPRLTGKSRRDMGPLMSSKSNLALIYNQQRFGQRKAVLVLDVQSPILSTIERVIPDVMGRDTD